MPRAWYTTDKAQTIAKRLVVFFCGLGVLWGLSYVPFIAPGFHTVQGGIYSASSTVGRAISRLFAQESTLSSQLELCTERLTQTTATAAQAEQANNEVTQWQQVVGYEQRSGVHGLAARIIARGETPASTVIIDRGANDGVAEGSAVVIGNGILYGTIISVEGTQSFVRVTEDARSALSATIQGATKTMGLVVGQEGAALQMQYIPQDTTIAIGDIVVTSGLGGKVPEGLILGTVQNIQAEPSAPFLTATILPVHDPREWTAVIVLPFPGTGNL